MVEVLLSRQKPYRSESFSLRYKTKLAHCPGILTKYHIRQINNLMKFPGTAKHEEGNLPNLIIIGAQKCGTTSLHYYLSLHPQISMSKEKELNFFIEEFNWHKGLEWYTSHFKGKAQIYGESSPGYTSYPRFLDIPARMHAVVPEAKLIYVVRDPIERMISNYMHDYCGNHENRSIEEALISSDHKGKNWYLCRSLYYAQLEQYLAYYPASQILLITAEDLRDQRQTTLCRVFKFLEIDSDFYSRRYAIRRHDSSRKRRKTELGMRLLQTRPAKLLKRLPHRFRWPIEGFLYWPVSYRVKRPTINDSLRQEIAKLLKDDVDRLRKFTGYELRNWSV